MFMKMRKMAMKKSTIAKGKHGKAFVFAGTKVKTQGGSPWEKSDLHKFKSGKIVSEKATAAGKNAFKNIAKWSGAVKQARKALGIKGFLPIGGKITAEKQFLTKAKSYKK